MREKLLFAGMLALSALYCVEVFSKSSLGPLQWAGLGIAALTIVPWAVNQVVSHRKRARRKEADRTYKAYKKQRAQDEGKTP